MGRPKMVGGENSSSKNMEDLKKKQGEILKRFEADIKVYKSEIAEYKEKLLAATEDATSRYTKKLLEESEKALKVVQSKVDDLKKNMENKKND